MLAKRERAPENPRVTPTPTAPDRRPSPLAATLVEALDAAALAPTGVTLHGLRGEVVRALPYAELRESARELAGRLLASGLERGDRLGLVAETSADFVILFFACHVAGLIPAPMPLPQPLGGRDAYLEVLARLLHSADAAAAWAPEPLRPQLEEAAARAGSRVLPPLDTLPPGDASAWKPSPDEACYLQFSSGSTRAPTGVLVTHRALMANALAITRDGLRTTTADRAVSWLPLFHDMGLVGFLLSPLTVGMSVDLMPTEAFVRRPLLWPRMMGPGGGTISYSPTFGYELCARRAETTDLSGLDLSGWRVAGVGGDMVRTGPLEAFAQRFAAARFDAGAFTASYGMAEATLALTMAPLGGGLREEEGPPRSGRPAARPPRRFVACGPVLPGHELQVRGDDGAPLPERTVGRAFVRGPSLMRGYFRRPEETAAVLDADGWLDTGDLGFLAEGQFTPTGRAKDLILLNGRNIWPQDLEWTAEAEVAGLRSGDVAAFPLADAEDEDGVVTLVQTRTRDPLARERLAAEVAAVLRSRHGVEAQVRLVGLNTLPHTSSGKLRRVKAREMYLAGAFAPVA